MEKQLDLDEFETLAFEEDEQGRYHFTVRAVRYAPYCPHCGSTLYNVHSHTRRAIRDRKMNDRNVFLTILGKRYTCLKCGKTYSENYRSVEKKDMMTKRLKAHLITALVIFSYAELAKRYQLSTATIKRVFDEFEAYADSQQQILAPAQLGLFFLRFNHGVHGCAIDLDENMLLDIFPAYDSACVMHFLSRMHGKDNLRRVFVEPVTEVRDIVRALFPDVQVALDKRRMATLMAGDPRAATGIQALTLADCAAARACAMACDVPQILREWAEHVFIPDCWHSQQQLLKLSWDFLSWNDSLQTNYPYRYRVLRNKILFRTAATHFAQYDLAVEQSDYDHVFSYQLYTGVPASPQQYRMRLVRGTGASIDTLLQLYPGGLPINKNYDLSEP